MVTKRLFVLSKPTYPLRQIGWAVRFAEVKEEAMLAWPGDTQQNAQPNRSPQQQHNPVNSGNVPKNQATGKITGCLPQWAHANLPCAPE